MTAAKPPFRADHVGSLLRNSAVKAARLDPIVVEALEHDQWLTRVALVFGVPTPRGCPTHADQTQRSNSPQP